MTNAVPFQFDMKRITGTDVIVQYVPSDFDPTKTHGVLVAKRVDQKTVRVGWSFVNEDKGDVFDRGFGLHVAMERIEKNRAKQFHPFDEDTVVAFCLRATNYFKQPVALAGMGGNHIPHA